MTSVRRSLKLTLLRACAELTFTCRTLAHYSIHPASMGNRTIFLVNNTLHCISNAKGICQNLRTCPKGRRSFEQLLFFFSSSLFLFTVWNKNNVNQLAFILDLSASVRFGRLFIVTLLHSLWELSLVHEYKAILFVD